MPNGHLAETIVWQHCAKLALSKTPASADADITTEEWTVSALQDERSSDIPSHPEEMKSVFDLRVGKHISLQGSARITPAGVISTGIAVAAMTLAVGYLISSVGRRR